MRSTTHILSKEQAAAQNQRTRVSILKEPPGPGSRTHVEIQTGGGSHLAHPSLPGGGNDPLKTRVQIHLPPGAGEHAPALPGPAAPALSPKEQLIASMERERAGLDELERTGRAAMERLGQMETAMADLEDREAEERAAAAELAALAGAETSPAGADPFAGGALGPAGDDSAPIIETTGELAPSKAKGPPKRKSRKGSRGMPGEGSED